VTQFSDQEGKYANTIGFSAGKAFPPSEAMVVEVACSVVGDSTLVVSDDVLELVFSPVTSLSVEGVVVEPTGSLSTRGSSLFSLTH